MSSYILGLATAVPPFSITQNEAMRKQSLFFELSPQQEKQITALYQNSGITKRHIVTPDFSLDRAEWNFWGCDFPKTVPGMTKRNDVYKKEAPLLAHQAAEKAIKKWGGDPSQLTHVISVSCTGVVAPGIEFSLISTLGLQRTIMRLGINFMGCFGAFKGLEVANAFACANPNNRILVVCTELCSLHFQAELDSDNLLANSIFADGAAAVIVGGNPKDSEIPLWEIFNHRSIGLDNSLGQMSWEAGDNGYRMRLSNFVPVSIAKNIQPFIETLLENKVDISSCGWAVHPGGRAILHLVEKKLGITKDQTKASWETLTNYGNMSSATFLFVLENLILKGNIKNWTAGVGFGPGLSMEGVLLRKS
jgi:predicted naringenin-chalcone synthase